VTMALAAPGRGVRLAPRLGRPRPTGPLR
jgi:hypothetical protein